MTPKCIGGCVPLFMLGVVFDVIGLTVLLVGALADLRMDGRFYGDFLIYTGSIVVFFSLAWWVLWYTGTVQIASEELEKNKLNKFAQWARKISTRLSKNGAKTLQVIDKSMKPTNVSVSDHVNISTRISWQDSGIQSYDNAAFESSIDISTMSEKSVQLDLFKNSQILYSTVQNDRPEKLL